VKRVVAFKRDHLTWGPKKIVAGLQRAHPHTRWPATSTIGEILDRHGLVTRRRKRNKATPSARPLSHCVHPNDVWCIDFKGWFRTQDGLRCDPLTLCDGDTRFVLRCHALSGKTDTPTVQASLEIAFREYGLPVAIRSDNGSPFASTGLAGLSKLSVWWMALGIALERIRPGHPEENGRLERFHKTLKAETAMPPKNSIRQQQQAFNRFVEEYNFERPHEALGQRVPADLYTPSPRPFPARLPATPDYDHAAEVRKVKASGHIKWRGQEIYVSQALAGHYIGLDPLDDGTYLVYCYHTAIGILGVKATRTKPLKPAR
jgi:transposase InsO family protein